MVENYAYWCSPRVNGEETRKRHAGDNNSRQIQLRVLKIVISMIEQGNIVPENRKSVVHNSTCYDEYATGFLVQFSLFKTFLSHFSP